MAQSIPCWYSAYWFICKHLLCKDEDKNNTVIENFECQTKIFKCMVNEQNLSVRMWAKVSVNAITSFHSILSRKSVNLVFLLMQALKSPIPMLILWALPAISLHQVDQEKEWPAEDFVLAT